VAGVSGPCKFKNLKIKGWQLRLAHGHLGVGGTPRRGPESVLDLVCGRFQFGGN
jgi:hypothetical protein